ncbi:MAG: hypothetical protein VKJ05_06995 [Synechococcaceae cyanobacterium]|nr:hypothetical protein [Synechococcaceae cyanobacterium]
MPPEFAQQLQQLFARQMAVAYLHRCGVPTLPLNLVSARLEELEAAGDLAACAALRAEFLSDPEVEPAGGTGPEPHG